MRRRNKCVAVPTTGSISPANNHAAPPHRKRPEIMQHFLKAFSRSADAWIVAAKLLDQLDIVVDEPETALDAALGGKPLRRLLVGSKAGLVGEIAIACHDNLLSWLLLQAEPAAA